MTIREKSCRKRSALQTPVMSNLALEVFEQMHYETFDDDIS